MRLTTQSDDWLDGKQEGLNEAAAILQRAIERGDTVHAALFDMLEAANKAWVARSTEFDETRQEWVDRPA